MQRAALHLRALALGSITFLAATAAAAPPPAAQLAPAFDAGPALPFDPGAVYTPFAAGRHLQSADATRPVEVRVRLLPDLPVYRFELIPDAAAAARPGAPRHIGSVVIRRGADTTPLQRIEVDGWLDAPELVHGTAFADFDFDGLPDLALIYNGGAKWRSYRVYFFDRASGRFVADGLTTALAAHGSSREPLLDPRRRQVAFHRLGSGDCLKDFVTEETYVLDHRRLRLVGAERMTVRGHACVTEILRPGGGGALRVIRVEPGPDLPIP